MGLEIGIIPYKACHNPIFNPPLLNFAHFFQKSLENSKKKIKSKKHIFLKYLRCCLHFQRLFKRFKNSKIYFRRIQFLRIQFKIIDIFFPHYVDIVFLKKYLNNGTKSAKNIKRK
jgi:hypothetical protein